MPEMLDKTIAEPVADDLERAKREQEEKIIVEKVRDMRRCLYRLMPIAKRIEFFSKMTSIVRELKARHKDYLNVYLFHIISGSTAIDRKECTSLDFPENDSIVKILEELCDNYLVKEKK